MIKPILTKKIFIARVEKWCKKVECIHIGTQTDFAIPDSKITQTDFSPVKCTTQMEDIPRTVSKTKKTPPKIPKEGDLSCPLCRKSYTYMGGLRYHYKHIHNERENCCYRCGVKHKNFPSLLLHFKSCIIK